MEIKGMIQPGQWRIIWKSPKLPSSPWAMPTFLPEQMRKDISEALFHMPKDDPAAWEALTMGKMEAFQRVSHEDYAPIFVNVVGLGPFAGIMAIAMSDTGTFAKLFAEAIENVDRRPVEGIRAAGGNWLHVMRFGILSQVFPVMLSNGLYYFESNTRSATILGVVGAGGIGLQLADRIRVNNWDEACFIIILILLTVSLIDTLSKEIRLRMINNPETRA
jgi:phosphonate transport system permease protein